VVQFGFRGNGDGKMVRKGFTLIELLVVIGIIGNLMAQSSLGLESAVERDGLTGVEGKGDLVITVADACGHRRCGMNDGVNEFAA